MKMAQKAREVWVWMMLALAVLTVSVSARPAGAQGTDLFNNTNTGGTANRPTNPTVFTLNAAARISELVTYHWNNGRGATPGTIGLRSQNGQTFGPFAARGVAGQGNAPNVNWVAPANVTVPAGTYTVRDSDPGTWSHNPQSFSRGFAIVRGSLVAGGAPPLPPQPSPSLAPPGFRPCFVNSGSAASAGPCVLVPGALLWVHMSRQLPNPPANLMFKAVLAAGVPAAVRSPLTGGGQYYSTPVPTQLCATGTGGVWDIFLLDRTNQPWGNIGRLTVDCRAYRR